MPLLEQYCGVNRARDVAIFIKREQRESFKMSRKRICKMAGALLKPEVILQSARLKPRQTGVPRGDRVKSDYGF